MVLKLLHGKKEYALPKKRVKIGRALGNDIRVSDGMVSSNHAVISNGFLSDIGSTNGTLYNGKPAAKHRRYKLKKGDLINCGEQVFRIVEGSGAFSTDQRDEFMRSKVFLGSDDVKKGDDDDPDSNLTVQELMDQEFGKIIGHQNIKDQLKQFYKKVQLDKIRAKNGKAKEKNRLFHMIFAGPPGTGKTTMANLVGRLMVKMGVIKSNKVVFVNNALDLLAGYSGQTPAKVDAKVEEARGGVLFIDEAYSIVKSDKHQQDSFGKEAIETIMKHLDPPSAVFIFAGYSLPMEDFLKVNPGLARRIPFRYEFKAYRLDELFEIAKVMCAANGELLGEGTEQGIKELLETVDDKQRQEQNAGLCGNWISMAQIERDDRIDIDAAIANPELASTLQIEDFEAALEKIKLTA